MRTCDNCGNSFSSKSNLNRHIKICTGTGEIFTCAKCNATFNRKDNYDCHLRSCNSSSKEELEKTIVELKTIISQKEKHERYLRKQQRKREQKSEEQIKNLQDKLADANKVTITHNNHQRTINIMNYFMIPITEEYLDEHSAKLTLCDALSAENLAEFALKNHFPKHAIICTNKKEKNVKYKDTDDKIVIDKEMTEINNKFFKSIIPYYDEKMKPLGGKLFDRLRPQRPKDEETQQHIDTILNQTEEENEEEENEEETTSNASLSPLRGRENEEKENDEENDEDNEPEIIDANNIGIAIDKLADDLKNIRDFSGRNSYHEKFKAHICKNRHLPKGIPNSDPNIENATEVK